MKWLVRVRNEQRRRERDDLRSSAQLERAQLDGSVREELAVALERRHVLLAQGDPRLDPVPSPRLDQEHQVLIDRQVDPARAVTHTGLPHPKSAS